MDTCDWNLCFICQSDSVQPVTDPASSIKLCGHPQKLEACYRELLSNIIELNELGDLLSYVVLDDIIGDGGDGADSTAELMKSNHVVWHKKLLKCR